MVPLLTIRHATGAYPVYFGRGFLSRLGELVEPRGQAFVVTSPNLRERYGYPVASSFPAPLPLIEIEEGEARKTLATVESLVSALLEAGARRDSMILAVGGGVVGDTSGFAASILLRGIDLVQIPTTLLAQVDSSIGGKVGVNHAKGKNLIGSFHHPRAVVVDPSTLDSLHDQDFLSGLFEALKGGVVGDPELFERITNAPGALLARDRETIDEVIRRKIGVKASIVGADEREGGIRRLLNYGHTIGHALEAAAGYEGITHGEGVAWGMIGANAIALARGVLPRSEATRIESAILALKPAPLRALTREDVLAAAAHDKKNRLGKRVMVLPRRIGECTVVEDVAEHELAHGIDAVLASQ
jgi:3-dehydroquinate synthase